VLGVGDVARGKHVRRARFEAIVDEDAVVRFDPGGGSQICSWSYADAHHHEVGVDSIALRCADRLDPGVTLKRRECGVGQHLHSVISMDVAVDRAELGSQNAFEGQR
jgi:hypothetical protein